MTIYLISGLGADESAFKNLRFRETIRPVFINWIEPKLNENLVSYCARLSIQIDHRQPFVLLGMSFGSIVALEMAKIFPAEKTILLSGIQSYRQIPVWLRLAGIFRLNKIIPKGLLTQVLPFTYWLFGVTKKEERELLRIIIQQSSPVFMQWAIEILLHWKGEFKSEKILRIHGNRDKLLPPGAWHVDYLVNGGGHFMVYSKAEEINEIIEEIFPQHDVLKPSGLDI